MFLRSIRFKMLVWYMAFLAITLFLFSLALYGSFDKALYGDYDDLLSSRAEGIADSVNAYWNAKKAGAAENSRGIVHDSANPPGDFIALSRGWVDQKRKDPELMSIFAQILSTKGEPIVSSKASPRLNAIPKDDFNDILDGEDSFDVIPGEEPSGKKAKFRVYTKPVIEDGNVMYVVQVGGPLGLLSLALRNLRFLLFLLLPIAMILAGLPGVLLVRLTLRPVDKMIDTLKQITAENLKLKIHMPDTKDEIKRLADTFNDMIERLDRSFSSQQKFIRDISRELKIPVNLLKEELEASLAKNCTEVEYKALLLKALKEADGFSRIIEDLSIISQFSEERPVLEIRNINLTALIEKVFSQMKAIAAEKDINTSLSCVEGIRIDGDRDQLAEALSHLMENAIKYTYRKGSISVSLKRSGQFAQVSVSDTGIGIPDDEIPYIFDRFYQVAKPRGVKGGFGLGLSSVKAIVESHKGSIEVESREGRGSSFTILLPLKYPG